MPSSTSSSRPVYLDLLRIRLTVTAVASVLHRITGVLLSVSIPAVLWLLQRSLNGPEGYQQVLDLAHSLALRLIGALLLWALLHHLIAGVRFLLLDLKIGISLRPARAGAWAVNIASLLIFLVLLGLAIL
jgi:succinate dehydrogenase cytochrome b subunit